MSFTRTEQFLDGIASGASVPAPFTREEQYLQKIIEKVEELEAEISGGGGGDVVLCHLTLTDDTLAVTDMTAGEIFEAVDSGKRVVGLANTGTDAYQSVDFIFVAYMDDAYTAYISLFDPNSVGWTYFSNATDTASNYFSFDVTDPVT